MIDALMPLAYSNAATKAPVPSARSPGLLKYL